MANSSDIEIAMRKKFRTLIGAETSKAKPNKQTIENLKCQLAEWDLNARN
jgi:hypothetical protein